jgi:hypothetical protein
VLKLQLRDFAQAPQVTRRIAEFSGQKCPDKIPGGLGPNRAATDADHVHVVVLDALCR